MERPQDQLDCQRSAFSFAEGVHYLNCAYIGPLPRVAQEAGVQGIGRKADPTSITVPDFYRDSNELRSLFARLIHGTAPERVAILPSVSYGIAIAARNLACAAGQNIVLAGEQFPSNVYSWRRLARETNAELRTVAAPITSPPRADAWNEALLNAIDDTTSIVALPQVHWTDGTRFDLVRIGARARQVGAAFVVDGTQSIGALEFDVREVQPDAVLCATYKWLLGPYSLALGWFGPRFDDGVPLEETWIGRKDSDNFQELVNYRDEYRAGAARYDVGEHSNFINMPIAVASLRYVLELGTARIQRYCAALFADVLEEAQRLGFATEAATGRGSHLFGLRVPRGTDLAALHSALQQRNVFASLRGSALRVSPHVYNDEADAQALLSVLRDFGGSAAASP